MTPAPISVERLRELLAKATPGPWRCTDGPAGYQHRVSSDDADGETVCDVERTSADAALIVAAVNALPALLQQLAELETELQATRDDRETYAIQRDDAERAREEATGLLREAFDSIMKAAALAGIDPIPEPEPNSIGGRIAAFLAASGGKENG